MSGLDAPCGSLECHSKLELVACDQGERVRNGLIVDLVRPDASMMAVSIRRCEGDAAENEFILVCVPIAEMQAKILPPALHWSRRRIYF